MRSPLAVVLYSNFPVELVATHWRSSTLALVLSAKHAASGASRRAVRRVKLRPMGYMYLFLTTRFCLHHHWSGAFAFPGFVSPSLLPFLAFFFLPFGLSFPTLSGSLNKIPPAGLSWSRTACKRLRAAMAASSLVSAGTSGSANGAPLMSNKLFSSFHFPAQ